MESPPEGAGDAARAEPSNTAAPEQAVETPAALHARLRGMLRGFREINEADPFGNPISRMALELTRMADKGETPPGSLPSLVLHLVESAFSRRAARLAAYAGQIDPAANEASLTALLSSCARPDPAGPPLPFEDFRRLVETVHSGIVLTAHPTFSTSREAARALAAVASAPSGQARAKAESSRPEGANSHRPPAGLTLDMELSWATEAIENAHGALSRLHTLVLRAAQRLYPDRWTTLVPRVVTIASWVGYDHDGRSDIGWLDTLRVRLRMKLAQLTRLLAAAADIRRGAPESRAAPTLELIESVLALAAKQVELQVEASLSSPEDPAEQAVRVARRLVEGREHALTSTGRIVQWLTSAIAVAEDPELSLRLSVLRAAAFGHGLGLAHSHFRLNATQLHNAVRRQIGLEASPSDPSYRRSFVNAVNDLIARAEPASVNLGSLMAERTSARRMFMMIAELAKHIDAETKVRFLIAETETAFTLLVALYFARLFGVEHLVEISPLFETEEALERGDAILDEALRSPHYRAYVQRTGRVCLQFGYSDSGRYIGQMAATYWIERLRFRIAAVLSRHGLRGIQVVLFDTHGESIGRGGHPQSLADRIRYLSPPASRSAFRDAGLTVKQEVSFQGGDGYLHFLSPEVAFASLSRIVLAALGPEPEVERDPIYEEGDFATEFFATVRQEFAQIVDDPDYAALLSAYGTNMLDRAGSRPAQRQHEWQGQAELTHPSQLRAIPNNAVLHQLGLLANTVSGLGRATAKDPERFRAMLQGSPRFRRAMKMVGFATSLSDLDVLRAYVDTLDPGMWWNRSGRTRNPARRDELRAIAGHLERSPLHAQLIKIFRRLQADYLLLCDQLREPSAEAVLRESAIEPEAREELILLHALRISVIHRIYLLASHVPDFTPHHGLTRDDLIRHVLRLDIDAAVTRLSEIFPRRGPSEIATRDFSEPASYEGGTSQTYEVEHERIFGPMRASFELVRQISAAITYHVGAIG